MRKASSRLRVRFDQVTTQSPHRNALVVMVDNDIVAETVSKDNHVTKWLGLPALYIHGGQENEGTTSETSVIKMTGWNRRQKRDWTLYVFQSALVNTLFVIMRVLTKVRFRSGGT